MQEPIDAATPISVTLTALEWNQVLSVVQEGPYRVVAPLIGKISEQAQAGAGLAPARSNGAETGPSHS